MKVFIGWSGERSQHMGQALREWMPLVLHFVEPWLSENDIAAGERWGPAMGKELELSNFGIICVTRENATSPWIFFEAGSLAKSFEESRVIPLLLDLEFSEISGPLAQFQAKKADRNGLREVIQSVNKAASEPVAEATVTQLFEALWPKLAEKLSAIPEQAAVAKTSRPQHEILEELVGGVRSLEARLRDVEAMVSGELPRSRRRRSHLDPLMLHEMGMMIGGGPGDPTALLLAASMFREELPFLYELGMEAYRAAKYADPEEAQDCMRRFRRAAKMLMRPPFMEETSIHPRELDMVMHELERFIVEEGPAEERPRTRPRPRKAGEEEHPSSSSRQTASDL